MNNSSAKQTNLSESSAAMPIGGRSGQGGNNYSSAERKVRGGFGFALACLAIVGAVSYLSVVRMRGDAAWVQHTFEVIGHLESLLSTTTDAETGQRGYVITSDERYLEPYLQAVQTSHSELRRLRELTVDNSAQQRRLESLAPLVDERLAVCRAAIDLRRNPGSDATQRDLLESKGKAVQDQIRRFVSEMKGTEEDLLKEREVRAGGSAKITQAVIIGGGVLAFGFVGLAWLAIRRDFSGRLRAEQALREARDQLEVRVRERTADLARANESLRDNERLLQETGQLAKVGGWNFDPVSGDGRWTDEVARIHDLDLDVKPNKEMGLQFYPGESRARIESALKKAIEEGTPYDLELEFVSAKGVRKWVRTVCRPLLESGKVVRVQGALQDITERKHAEEMNERLAGIVNSSDDAIISKTLEGIITSWNRGAEKLFGYAAEEALGKSMLMLFPPERVREESEIIARIKRGESMEHFETVRIRKDGTQIDVSVTLSPVRDDQGKIIGASKIARDITERKLAEEAVRQSEARYRTLFDTLIEGFCTIEMIFDAGGKPVDYRFLEINPAFEKQTGLHNAQGRLMRDLAPDHEAYWFEIYGKIALTGEPAHFENEAKALGRHYDVCAYRVGGPESRKVAILFNDITERKQAEMKMRSQLARLELLDRITRAIAERQDLSSIFQVVIRTLEDHLPIDFGCVCLYDSTTEALTVTSISARGKELAKELALSEQTRVTIDQNGLSRCIRGQLVYEPDIRQAQFPFPQRLARAGLRSFVAAPLLAESSVFGLLIAARREANSFSSGDCEFLRQLSGHVALAANQAQIYGALEKAYEDLRQTQQAVLQQERLRALGQMASGIAHDINNAISPIALYAESLLGMEPHLSARGREYLETIERAIADVAATVARMSEFYRQREPQLSLAPVQLNRLVTEVTNLTRARWSDMPQQRGIMIELRSELAADLPEVMGVESEIREALTNLIFNAVDAMPKGGTLTLKTKARREGPDSAEAARSLVDVEVTDTGVGMDEETRRRCLEPFFTTKGERGTGLGLAMVYGMVQRHSSDIEIESKVGKGTTVRLSFGLPVTQKIGSVPPLTVRTVPPRMRILVVDDDPVLLKALRDILETDGHVVTAASGGQEGINAFRAAEKDAEPFAIVITDLGMPYVDGRQVAAAVKAASPSTAVILLTGWGQRMVAEGDIPPHVDRVLSKPPKIQALREALVQCARMAEHQVAG